MSPQEFARRIRKFRERSGLSQAEAAAIVGVTANSFARWEREERCPPPETEVLTREGVIRKLKGRGVKA